MLLSYLFSNPFVFAIIALGLTVALTIHEFAHAWVADKLGDPTPAHQGRVTLNPLAHLDPLGTLAILLVGFGWGKPVQFDPFNLKNPKRDTALVALAGPAANLLLATVLALVLRFLPAETQLGTVLLPALFYTLYVNCMLAIFNLVPVYPLDGQKILSALLPASTSYNYEVFMQRYGSFLLLLLIVPWNGVSPVSQLISPIIEFVVSLLLGASASFL